MENDWPAGEVFVAIKKAGSSVQRVPGVIDGRALWKQQHHKTNTNPSMWEQLLEKLEWQLEALTHFFGCLVGST